MHKIQTSVNKNNSDNIIAWTYKAHGPDPQRCLTPMGIEDLGSLHHAGPDPVFLMLPEFSQSSAGVLGMWEMQEQIQ